MKNTTRFISIFGAIILLLNAFLCTNCFAEDESEKLDLFTMEAEYVDFFGLSGPGISNSATETQMIVSDAKGKLGASNGHYVAYTHAPDITLTFEFESEAESVGTLILRLGSDLGDIENYGSQALGITINGEPLDYDTTFTLDGSCFHDYVITEELPIQEGANTLELTVLLSDVLEAQFGTFQTFGPLFDCVKIDTDATLTWEPLTDNI